MRHQVIFVDFIAKCVLLATDFESSGSQPIATGYLLDGSTYAALPAARPERGAYLTSVELDRLNDELELSDGHEDPSEATVELEQFMLRLKNDIRIIEAGRRLLAESGRPARASETLRHLRGRDFLPASRPSPAPRD